MYEIHQFNSFFSYSTKLSNNNTFLFFWFFFGTVKIVEILYLLYLEIFVWHPVLILSTFPFNFFLNFLFCALNQLVVLCYPPNVTSTIISSFWILPLFSSIFLKNLFFLKTHSENVCLFSQNIAIFRIFKAVLHYHFSLHTRNH